MSKDIRWSYDSRTGELDIWDSLDGRISHYDRCGMAAYEFCAQGRVTEILDKKKLHSIVATIYGNRPISGDAEGYNFNKAKADELREAAKKAVEQHYEPYPVHWQLTF